MMKKKNFFTGSVFQFYIPEIRKYAFCKFFDFTHISEFHGLLAQIFNKFVDTEKNSLNDLRENDWLFGPRSMHKWPNLRKDTGWKSLGILTAPTDEVIPDFKDVQAANYVVEDESKIGPWHPVHALLKRGMNCRYEQIRHLEMMTLTTKAALVERAGMEYCRINGLNIGDFYNLENRSTLYMYWQMINVPIYSTIPKEMRGKALVQQPENITSNKAGMGGPPFIFVGMPGSASNANLSTLSVNLTHKTSIPFTIKDKLLSARVDGIAYYISFLENIKELKDWNKLAKDFELPPQKSPVTKNEIIKRFDYLRHSIPDLYKDIHYETALLIMEEMETISDIEVYSFLL